MNLEIKELIDGKVAIECKYMIDKDEYKSFIDKDRIVQNNFESMVNYIVRYLSQDNKIGEMTLSYEIYNLDIKETMVYLEKMKKLLMIDNYKGSNFDKDNRRIVNNIELAISKNCVLLVVQCMATYYTEDRIMVY